MIAVTLYGKPGCVQCDSTERAFKKKGVPYKKVDVSKDPEAFDHIVRLGYMQVPVVQLGKDGRHWGGFQPDLINELAEQCVSTPTDADSAATA